MLRRQFQLDLVESAMAVLDLHALWKLPPKITTPARRTKFQIDESKLISATRSTIILSVNINVCSKNTIALEILNWNSIYLKSLVNKIVVLSLYLDYWVSPFNYSHNLMIKMSSLELLKQSTRVDVYKFVWMFINSSTLVTFVLMY